jgi:signal transduction histidine kinase
MLALRRLPLPSRAVSRAVADVLVVAAVFGAAAIEPVWSRTDRPGWQWTLAAALSGLALLGRRRMPLASVLGVLAVWGAVHADRAVDDPPFQFIALLIGAYALGAHRNLRDGLIGVAATVVVFAALNLGRGEEVGAAIAGAVQFSVLFAFGRIIARSGARERALHARAQRLEAERDARAAQAVADERARIARDLHDALGHAISVVVVQVGAVRMRLRDDQRDERGILLAAERIGRDSVAEMRKMVGILREGDGDANGLPSGLGAVEDVAASVRAAGVDVHVEVEGVAPSTPAGVDVAGFRIVQEALTNVLKHAPGARATVRIVYEPDAVVLEVADNGAGRRASGAGEAGHGLIGMRERVALYGGTLEAGPANGRGFAVRARLPFGRNGA